MELVEEAEVQAISRSRVAEIRQLSQPDAAALADFFEVLVTSGSSSLFHPHPFSPEQAVVVSGYRGLDIYAGVFAPDVMVGYGMLRGWDQGYEIPSLGIAVHPERRRRGIGLALMTYLHMCAALRGAPSIRLKVYTHNAPAVALYRALGYRFGGEEAEQVVGFLDL